MRSSKNASDSTRNGDPCARSGRGTRNESIDLNQPLRLRFIDPDASESRISRASHGVVGGKRMTAGSSAFNHLKNKRNEIEPGVVSKRSSTRTIQSSAASGRGSQGFPFVYFVGGLTCAILFWLYALPVLRSSSQAYQPGKSDINDRPDAAAKANSLNDLSPASGNREESKVLLVQDVLRTAERGQGAGAGRSALIAIDDLTEAASVEPVLTRSSAETLSRRPKVIGLGGGAAMDAAKLVAAIVP
ncbi:MAG: hypothetical protein AAGG44_16840, partial [Planctomycetota bacterium]